jgi:hypothetical protein
MNHIKTCTLAILTAMILLASCTIEKRVYRPGYHIEWHHSKKSIAKTEKAGRTEKPDDRISKNKIDPLPNQLNTDAGNFASNTNEITLSKPVSNILKKKKKSTLLNQIKSNLNTDCDVIIMRNGQEIQAKVLEVG